MSKGPSQTTNSNQFTDQTFNDISNMIQNMSSQGLTNYQNQQNTANNINSNQNTVNTNNQSTTGTTGSTSAGTSSGATTGTSANTFNPWAPAMPGLNNILTSLNNQSTALTPAQQAAIAATQGAAGSMPGFGNAATNAVSNMYSSINGIPEAGLWGNAYGNYAGAMSPFQSLSNLNPMNTPGFKDALFDPVSGINAQIANNTKAMFAGAGRDPVGNADASKAIAFGESQADLPAMMSQYNTNVANYLGANDRAFQGAGQTATGMTNLLQTPIQNETTALANSMNAGQLWMQPSTTQLGAANTAYGLPYSNIALPAGMYSNIAQLGGSNAGQTAGTQVGATTGATTGTSSTNTVGGSTSNMVGNQQQVGSTTGSGSQQTNKTSTGSTSGSQSGTQVGTSIGNSTTTGSQSPWATAAGIALGLMSMMPNFNNA
jgi:hypothetical protein